MSLVVVLVDEYDGDGESETYVQVDEVVVTSDATTEELDEVIAFVRSMRG